MADNARSGEPRGKVDELAHCVIGAAIEVHRHLGPGFLESVYEEALAIELTSRQIPFRRQLKVNVYYKQSPVGEGRVDFLVDDELVVELKAVSEMNPIFTAQTISYLKTLNKRLALLLNFNVIVMKDGIKRIAY